MITDKDKFKQLLAKKDLPVLDDNFEEMVMDQIFKEELRSSIAGQYVRKMYVFFGAGFVLGLVAMFSISNVVFSWGEWEVTIPPVVLQVPFVSGVSSVLGTRKNGSRPIKKTNCFKL